jgi:hypothetical protein
MSEPGMIAYHAATNNGQIMWDSLHDKDKAMWAEVEAAVRADERAKVIEECATAAHEWMWVAGLESDMHSVAAAIRKLGD